MKDSPMIPIPKKRLAAFHQGKSVQRTFPERLHPKKGDSFPWSSPKASGTAEIVSCRRPDKGLVICRVKKIM